MASLLLPKKKLRTANRRVLPAFVAIVLVGVAAFSILMNLVTKERENRLKGFDLEEMATGFIPDDFHPSLLSNYTTRISSRKLTLGGRPRLKRTLLDLKNQPVPRGMKAINLTIALKDTDATVLVGSFADFDTQVVFTPNLAYYEPPVNVPDDGTASQVFWDQLDAIRNNYTDPLVKPSISTKKADLPFKPSIKHLGVLLDAGRSYFPLPWLRNLFDILEQMNFNLVHFRLTDDQAFNILLDTHPELAHAAWNAPTKTTVYTPNELRELVRYASERGIILMPEINIPGHAGGWAGSRPGLVVPCAPFVCEKGYGLPLNISHPGIYDMMENIIKEVIAIFSTSPYIHLGGDEVEMASPCFQDVHQEMMDYNVFEERVAEILHTLKIPQSRVVRWEMTGQADSRSRVGKIPHYWISTNYMGDPYSMPGTPIKDKLKRELENNPNATKIGQLFVSNGLYFDTNAQDSGWVVHESTRRLVLQARYEPLAIVAGTFELDPNFWFDRNIVGRLLAVAMGASNITFTEGNFTEYYFYYCRLIDLPEDMCRRYGIPIMPEILYKMTWANITSGWRRNLCDRLTLGIDVPELVRWHGRGERLSMAGTSDFWDGFGQDRPPRKQVTNQNILAIAGAANAFQHTGVKYTGIIIDLVNDGSYSSHRVSRLVSIVDTMAKLGMNMLQLRIMNEYGFAYEIESFTLSNSDADSISWNVAGIHSHPYNSTVLRELVAYASERGVEVVPEISLSTRAGGWFGGDMITPCAQTLCKQGRGITTNVTNPLFLPMVFSVIEELRNIFITTEFLHLGFDERKEAQQCNNEVHFSPDLDKFEQKLELLLKLMKIPLEKVVRWENGEGIEHASRAGKITHYRIHDVQRNSFNHFVSTNLVMDDPDSDLKDAWGIYEHTRKLANSKPEAILAWVGSMYSENWDLTNTLGRLVAVALGASDQSHTDPGAFRDVYFSACNGLITDDKICSEFGRQKDQERARSVFQRQRAKRLDASCHIRARKVLRYFPKTGFALSEHHDEL